MPRKDLDMIWTNQQAFTCRKNWKKIEKVKKERKQLRSKQAECTPQVTTLDRHKLDETEDRTQSEARGS